MYLFTYEPREVTRSCPRAQRLIMDIAGRSRQQKHYENRYSLELVLPQELSIGLSIITSGIIVVLQKHSCEVLLGRWCEHDVPSS